MQFKDGASVYTENDEEIGKLNRVVLDPVLREVTHIVIEKGLLFPEDKVVPIDMIDTSREDKITLETGIDSFDDLVPFEETHYMGVDEAEWYRSPGATSEPEYDYAPVFYYYPPFGGYGGYATYAYANRPVETERNIPEDTIPLQKGVDVLSVEGEKVGNVEQIFVDADSNQATHFLISSGLLFKERKLIPIHWVKNIHEDLITLAVSTRMLENLPDYKERE
ncbi:MAG: PRC-barrel domain containing protein [Chloroflexi bacterium]|nr:MAG: PRC-barrel domain containing protein [Chloroflexota bacterium]